MRYRPINREPDDPRLGRYIPDDWGHVEKYPLSALAPEERPTRRPVVIGVDWYTEMFHPEQDAESGEYFIARGGPNTLTEAQGGHCVCLEPGGEPDNEEWRAFYDQAQDQACVGFGWSRCMSILNGQLYAARWLWDRSKERDQWSETNPGDNQGSSVRAGAEVLTTAGHVAWSDAYADEDYRERAGYEPIPDQGLLTFRWAESVDDVHAVLDNPRANELGAVPVLNSWHNYPHRVWLPDEVLDFLMQQQGEIAIPTDR